jgi:hypothetical protein
MKTPSDISITYDSTEISHKVVAALTSFNVQANPISGNWTMVVRDKDQSFAPTSGRKISLTVDGVQLVGGYNTRIGRGDFFAAVDTTNPGSLKTRKWTLTGPDFNILFDKRVVHDPGDHFSALRIPEAKRTLSKALIHLFDNYIDGIVGLDYTTYVDDIDIDYGREDGLYIQQGSYLREQMEDFAKWGALTYYIDGGFNLHFHEYESIRKPWCFVDAHPNKVNSIGFREGGYEEDFDVLVTDGLVWGGSALAKGDDPEDEEGIGVVFARYPDYPIVDATYNNRLQSAAKEQAAFDRQAKYGRWQRAEVAIGQSNYLTQASVKQRAFTMVAGQTGVPPSLGIEGGFNKPIERMTATWFAHDVPGGDHVRPGEVMDFILYTQGADAQHPLVASLPLRSLRISFPALPGNNPAHEPLSYVRFDGEFGTSMSDSRYLWKYLQRRDRRRDRRASVSVDNSSISGVPGARATIYPLQTPDGVLDYFDLPFSLTYGTVDVYLNGIRQREGLDVYILGAQIGFTTPPEIGDQIYVIGVVRGNA